jgi:hypothetical protein
MSHVSVIIMLSLCAAVPANAAPPQTDADDAKLICKNQPRTNTRFRTRICHSKAGWEKITEQAQRSAGESFNRGGRPIDERDKAGLTYRPY